MTSTQLIYSLLVGILITGLVLYIYKNKIYESFINNELINNMTLEEYLNKLVDYSNEITLDNYQQSCIDLHKELQIVMPKIKELEELDSLRYNKLMEQVHEIEENTLILSTRGCRQFDITLL